MTNDNDILYLKAKAYLESGIPVHITLKNGHWNNGKIKELKEDFFLIDDFEDGPIPIFFIELSPDGIIKFEPPIKRAGEVEDGSL